LDIQAGIMIQIHINGNHLINLVFNINSQQVKKQGRKQGYKRKNEDGGQNKWQKVMGT